MAVFFAFNVGCMAISYHVAVSGSNDNPGTAALPFRTVSKCVKACQTATAACDCEIAAGTYRESVALVNGISRPPRRLIAAPGATISGLDLLSNTSWQREPEAGCVWSVALPANTSFQQLFYGGNLMVEARWPNLDIADVPGSALSRATWHAVGKGSRYGHINAPALAEAPFSWSGALATLQVSHQFYTWTRIVQNHTQGGASFEYERDLPSIGSTGAHPNSTWSWGCDPMLQQKCNQFFLSGKREALDMAGEWFLDSAASRLYFWPPGSGKCDPPAEAVEVKARDYAIEVAAPAANISIAGLALHGAALRLDKCVGCSVANVRLTYPAYDRESRELNSHSTKGSVASTWLHGEHLRVTNFSLLYTNNHGLELSGTDIVVDNCRIGYTDWMGSLTYRPLGVSGNRISIRRCTVDHFGNAGVVTSIPNTLPVNLTTDPPPVPQPMVGRHLEFAYSHVFAGGTIGMDTALVYTGGWNAAGVEWHHNWVHDANEKCIRADDQSMNMSVHHNVAWGCGLSPGTDVASAKAGVGLLIKGDGHMIYANTLIRSNFTELCLPACVEPLKPFRKQYPLVVQNTQTQLFNSVARREVGYPCSCHNASAAKPGGNATANFEGYGSWQDLKLTDPANFDFTPTATSPLVDAGAILPPFTDGYVGKAPDIGAYERGGTRWRAGCVGMLGC